MKKIDGIIHEGRVYVADPDYAKCDKCDPSLMQGHRGKWRLSIMYNLRSK